MGAHDPNKTPPSYAVYLRKVYVFSALLQLVGLGETPQEVVTFTKLKPVVRGKSKMANDQAQFEVLFKFLTGNDPFPWQIALYRRFMNGQCERALDIPTGLGKTSIIAIWLIARVNGASLPRRLVYVVDRRAVVDQATEVALQLRDKVANDGRLRDALGLNERELPISTLRGQHVDNREWLEDPASSAIIVSTVDMFGSRLLFEGYGVSRKMRPYHAGLLGTDTLVVLDESHLVPPFEMLLRTVDEHPERFGPCEESGIKLIPALKLVSLSATGRSTNASVFGLTKNDLKHNVIRKRLDATKRLSTLELDDPKQLAATLADKAWNLADQGKTASRIIVFSNSREIAAKAKAAVETLAKGHTLKGAEPVQIDTQLFVGGRRVRERTMAACWLQEHGFLAGEKGMPSRPALVFATSAGEVGVDLDADQMVCDLVAWERMVQRLGRVNRRGDGDARIIVVVAEPQPDAKTQAALEKAPDTRTKGEQGKVDKFEASRDEVRVLRQPIEELPDDGKFKKASPGAIRQRRIDAENDKELAKILGAATTKPLLRPALTRPVVDAWSMTSLEKHTGRPLVAPWIRGWTDDRPQTTVVWRRYLPVRSGTTPTTTEMKDFFEAAPPHMSETLETETDRVLAWLAKRAQSALKDAEKQGDNAHSANVSHEPLPLHRESTVAFILGNSLDIIGVVKLSDVIFDSDDKKLNDKMKSDLAHKLYGSTLVLDCRLAGLSDDGLLDDKAQQIPRTADDTDQWLGDADGKSLQPPVPTFRIRESDDDTIPGEPNWRRCYWFASRLTEEGEPTQFLMIDKWKHSGTSEESRSAGRLQELEEHHEWAERVVKRLADGVNLPSDYKNMLMIVARLHDEGKRADRWQRAFSAPVNGSVYAKTPGPIKFKLLDGYRHEFGSLSALELDSQFNTLDDDLKELARHLVVAHHGFGRPVIRVTGCDDAPPSALEDRAREVALRFARLQKHWGPWGLAWWESLLRSADQQASRTNETSNAADGQEENNG